MSDWTIRLTERRDVNELLAHRAGPVPRPWTKNMLLDEIGSTETRRYTVRSQESTPLGTWASCLCSTNCTSTRWAPCQVSKFAASPRH